MKRIYFGLIFAIIAVFSVSFASSSQLTFSSQPNSLYSIGDVVDLTTNIVTTSNLNDFFSISLICNGLETQVHQQYLILSAGQQTSIPVKIPLISGFMGQTSGVCKLKSMIKNGNSSVLNYALTNEFRVSDLITITISSTGREFNPGELVTIAGNAVKENGENANGIAELKLTNGNLSVYSGSSAVKNGYFYFNFTLPSNIPAGQKLASLKIYETDSSAPQTNKGFVNFNVLINQIPTTLDLVSKNNAHDILPGRTYSIKGILYDQTGERIDSVVNFTVKKSGGEVMGQERVVTDRYVDIPVSYNDAPDSWSISADSRDLSAVSSFNILENEIVSVELINKTLLVTNRGNVPYNRPVEVRIGDKYMTVNVSLEVDESRKYVLSAPEGDYPVKVFSAGNDLFTGNIFLTGRAINIQEATSGLLGFIQSTWIWAIILVVLVFIIFFFFRKWHKKRFFKRINMNKKFRIRDGILISDGREENFSDGDRLVPTRNIADLSLSIQGEKQNLSVICLNIKNFGAVNSRKGGVNETMNRIRDVVDSSNAAVYENGSYLFFIFAPVKTKAFNNELAAIETCEKIQKILEEHNRLLKQKIEFGLSANYGSMVIKLGINGMKFMSIGNVLSTAKKLASLSDGSIFLSNEIKNRTATDIKTDKQSSGDLEFHTLVEVRNREKSQKFIREFMSKMEREEKDSNRKFFDN
ncbi:MAG: hypothetical protein PHH00_03065 [Candidatus Nanoarchaeia archaeon]|nr:hypothetical protein [Candidatus Nanoarchaeia archaeon]